VSALHVERLRVERMPGIRDGGFVLEGLAPGLTLVHGPNGSGKSTTARALEALLWPRAAAPADALLAGAFRLDGVRWEVDVAAGSIRYQCDGREAGSPPLPPDEARDRYRLSMHELLAADDAGFARAVARESAGGYDLLAAARALDPRRTASRCIRETAALRDARARLAEAQRAQEALFADEQRLHDLDRRLAERPLLGRQALLLERAIEHARSAAAVAEARRAVAAWDSRMERLQPDDAERLREIRDRLGAAVAARSAALLDRERALAVLRGSGLVDGGLPDGLLATLRQECERLREAERAASAAERGLRGCETRRDAERGVLAGAMDEDRLARLDLRGLASLAGFVRAAERLATDRALLEARLRDLAPGVDHAPPPRERLELGARLLQCWLRSPAPGAGAERRLRALGAVAAIGLIAAGIVLALGTPVLAAVAVAGAALLALILLAPRLSDARAVHRAEFDRLELGAPDAWTDSGVEARLDALLSEVARARIAEERALLRAETERELAAVRLKEKELAARRAALVGALGVDPGTPDASLPWLVERLGRLQSSLNDAAAARAELATAREQLAGGLAGVRERLDRFWTAAVPDVSSLAGAIDALDARDNAHRAARQQLQTLADILERCDGEIGGTSAQRLALLARLGVAEADETLVHTWSAERERFREVRERLQACVARHEADAERIRGAGPNAAAFLQADEADLAERLAAARIEIDELTRLHDDATRIRTRIEDAKRTHAVEDALAEVEGCEDALRQARERDTRSALAAALVEHVQRATRDQHLPAVFHRAREHLTRFTHGRHRLEFDDVDAPAFRALDTHTGRGHALDELSSATRIQLLVAVRLAFVEVQEGGVRLPLVLDETLGNTDDERARAMMDAIVEIAATGRQVFYLTAQPDEVARWLAVVAGGPELPHATLDLAAVRRQAARREVPALRVIGAPRRAVPSPEGRDHAAYGEALEVPGVDVLAPVDGVHLWYLVEDLSALHHLLDRLRVERWGALRALVEHGGGPLLDAATYARVRALARALEAALELRRIGQGKPVDAAVLRECGLVSDAFVDALDRLRRECGGDAVRLLEALERGEVRGFRSRVRDSLREWLSAHGYLDPRQPEAVIAIRGAALAAIASEISGGSVSVEDVDRLLERAGCGCPVPQPGAAAINRAMSAASKWVG
jgi:DNA repair protein SbcC/Rad50